MFRSRIYEKSLAGLSLAAAIALAFTGLFLSASNDIGAATCFVIAQFLTLTATLLGFDYKLNPTDHAQTRSGNPQ